MVEGLAAEAAHSLSQCCSLPVYIVSTIAVGVLSLRLQAEQQRGALEMQIA